MGHHPNQTLDLYRFDVYQHGTFQCLSARLHLQAVHHAVEWCCQGVFHFHGFQDQ